MSGRSQIRLSITRRETFAGGMMFGEVGAYERLSGRVEFAVDPAAAENAVVVDLQNAPRRDDGQVEFATDFDILKPVEMARGNRRVDLRRGESRHQAVPALWV